MKVCNWCKILGNNDQPLSLFDKLHKVGKNWYCDTHYVLKTGKQPDIGARI